MSDLTVVLGSLRVADAAMPQPADGEQLPPPDRSLNRMQRCLQARLDTEALQRAERSISRLRRLQTIRNKLQHRGGHDDLVRHLAALGIAWPPADWGAAWERIRREAADALAVLREELRVLAETTAD